jgi:hypothetical protein
VSSKSGSGCASSETVPRIADAGATRSVSAGSDDRRLICVVTVIEGNRGEIIRAHRAKGS